VRQRQRQRQRQRHLQRQRQRQRQQLCCGYNMRQKMYIQTYTVRHGSMKFNLLSRPAKIRCLHRRGKQLTNRIFDKEYENVIQT